jgi:hypothetical protein
MTAIAFARTPPKVKSQAMTEARRTLCAICLIDRRTGQPHRINGSALVLFSRDPEEAAAELLAGRDPDVWDVQVEPLGPEWRQ